MPRRRTSILTTRTAKKRRLRNLKVKTGLKKTLKELHGLVTEKKGAEAKTLLQKVFSQLDKAAKKKIIHPKTADRRKSRLAKMLGRL